MNRNRTLFTSDHVNPFLEWMDKKGFLLQESTNEYEAMRFLSIDSKLETVSFYKKKNAQAITIQGRSAELFTEYLREKK